MSFEAFVIDAPAKVNLALHVLGRRDDGYHELDSIVAFADRGDSLRFAPATDFELTVDGAFAHQLPAAGDNIIARAWQLGTAIAQARGVTVPGAAIHLTKALPVASGIGGGSANAAATLRGLMKIAGLPTDDADLRRAALSPLEVVRIFEEVSGRPFASVQVGSVGALAHGEIAFGCTPRVTWSDSA